MVHIHTNTPQKKFQLLKFDEIFFFYNFDKDAISAKYNGKEETDK